MYASHLALNHLAARGRIHLIQKGFLLDFSCTNNRSIEQDEIIHIHAWHVRSQTETHRSNASSSNCFSRLDKSDFLQVSF